jgi:hypothetical protein
MVGAISPGEKDLTKVSAKAQHDSDHLDSSPEIAFAMTSEVYRKNTDGQNSFRQRYFFRIFVYYH